MTFYLKFLSPTAKVERDKYKIDNIKIYKKLTDRIKIILEKISEEKIVLEDIYISTTTTLFFAPKLYTRKKIL